MWIILCLVTTMWFSTTQAAGNLTHNCENILQECHQPNSSWTRCFEERSKSCRIRGRSFSNFKRQMVNCSQMAESKPTPDHHVHIPASALQKSRENESVVEVILVTAVISSKHFKLVPHRTQGRGMQIRPNQPTRVEGAVMGDSVVVVKAGSRSVRNLSQLVTLTFKHNYMVENGTCAFWHEVDEMNGMGYWCPDGCNTSMNEMEFVCRCNHLSFFAVLVNPVSTVDESHSKNLSYITYVGSALSVLLTVFSLIIYTHLQRRRPEKAIGVHMHLTGALFCLHLSFLLSSFWVWLLDGNVEGRVCWMLGFFLHWSLLASLTWMALEGFHLYLLLVRVFNIYVRKYLLKLSLVGWGVPTIIVAVCGILSVYGIYIPPKLGDAKNYNSTVQMCWIKNDSIAVSYITTAGFSCLVILCNSFMLSVVVFKMWVLRGGCRGSKNSSAWNKMSKENASRLWKDCATVVGLSCVLGLPWGLAVTTYISLFGIYLFTILNSLQGVFMFLWSVALTCKSKSDNNSSVKDPSSQKMMTTSFNN
ncbi:adhesion G protein-coupled receptor G3-like [Channa argus]|uniref:adhesion G protein-coupled receptor G3-like n=1 Tax=Channa argus TaxID=215402 RepID=UPI003522BE55